MKRILLLLVTALVLLGLLVAPAQAVVFQGGTAEQQAYVLEVIEAGPWAVGQVEAPFFQEAEVIFLEDNPPWWKKGGTISAYGIANMDGSIEVYSELAPGYDGLLGEVMAHEWCHLFWFGRSSEFVEAWIEETTGGQPYDWSVFERSPVENFAECAKFLWDDKYIANTAPTTELRVWTPLEVRQFIADHDPIFPDIGGSDLELYEATAYLKYAGIMGGYTDGMFRPYSSLLKRHVALICGRMGIETPAGWENDYSPATRGDVRDNIAGLTWLEERWDEGITRGQLARLLWRTEPES